MSVNTQMTALANAIRNVTGKPGSLSLEAMADEVNGFLEQTPDFIVAEAERVAELVDWRDPNTFVMVCGSDMHLYAGNDSHENSYLSAKYAGMGIRELSKRIHIDCVAMLGDYSWMDSSDYTAAQTMQDITLFHRAAKIDETAELWSVGNHDLCYGDGVDRSLSLEELDEYIGSHSDGVRSADDPVRCYGYLDIPTQKIRIINMDTCTPESMTDGKWASQDVISTAQLQWLAEMALDLSDKEAASDWGIVVIGHHPMHYANNHFRRAMEILEAYRGKKTSVTPYYTSNTYTFADDPEDRAEIICNIHGHNHNCGYSQISSSFPIVVQYDEEGNMTTEPDVPAWLWRFCVPNMCFGRNNTPITSTNANFKYKYGEFDEDGNAVYWDKETGTAKATSFVVFAIDRANKKVNAYIFGAGKNRAVAYDGTYVPAVYTVTNTLSNVTGASGNPSTITEFGTVSLTFAANEGYELPNSVTVSGAEHTWDKSSGVLVLSVPTGPVTVTVTAVAAVVKPSYTNLVPTAKASDGVTIYGEDYNGDGTPDGYKNDMRLGSNGAYSAGTGFVATGFIQQTLENPIYIKGNELSSDNYTRLYTFKTYVGGVSTFVNCVGSRSGDTNSFDYWFTVETLGDKYYKLTPTQLLFDRAQEFGVSGSYYYHLSLPGTGDTLVVTDNEPIE